MFTALIDTHKAQLVGLEVVVARNRVPTISLEFGDGDPPESGQVPASFALEVSGTRGAVNCVLCGSEHKVVDKVVSTRLARVHCRPADALAEWLAKRPTTHLLYQRTPADKSLSQAISRWTGNRFRSVSSGDLADRRAPVGTGFLRPAAWGNGTFLTALTDMVAESTGHAAWNLLSGVLVFSSPASAALDLRPWALVSHGPATEGGHDWADFARRTPEHAEYLLSQLLGLSDPVIEGSWPLACGPLSHPNVSGYVHSIRYRFAAPEGNRGLSCVAELGARAGTDRPGTVWGGDITMPATFEGWDDGEWARFRLGAKSATGFGVFQSWGADLLAGEEVFAKIVGATGRRGDANLGASVKYEPGDAFLLSIGSGQIPLAFSVQGPGKFGQGVSVMLEAAGKIESHCSAYKLIEKK